MSTLDVNYAFKHFNFTAVWKPVVAPGPREDQLVELVYLARQGDTDALGKIADTMYCTLGRETYDAFQHIHRPGDVSYRVWFYDKLFDFFGILLYEEVSADRFKDGKWEHIYADLPLEEGFHIISCWGEVVQPDDIEGAFRPEDNDSGLWYELAQAVSGAPNNRLQVLLDCLKGRGRATLSSERRRTRWKKNQTRDSIIMSGLRQGLDKVAICQQLDAHRVPLLRALVDLGLESWVAGWADARNAIQQLFAKTLAKL